MRADARHRPADPRVRRFPDLLAEAVADDLRRELEAEQAESGSNADDPHEADVDPCAKRPPG